MKQISPQGLYAEKTSGACTQPLNEGNLESGLD